MSMGADSHTGYVTVAEIAAAFRVSASNVYRLASEHKWRKYRLNRSVRYRWDDVEESMRHRAEVLASRNQMR